MNLINVRKMEHIKNKSLSQSVHYAVRFTEDYLALLTCKCSIFNRYRYASLNDRDTF